MRNMLKRLMGRVGLEPTTTELKDSQTVVSLTFEWPGNPEPNKFLILALIPAFVVLLWAFVLLIGNS